jgi:hypothetical protein
MIGGGAIAASRRKRECAHVTIALAKLLVSVAREQQQHVYPSDGETHRQKPRCNWRRTDCGSNRSRTSIKSRLDSCLRAVVKGKSMRSPVVSFVYLFGPWAALCCASALLLCGCSVFFGDKRSLVATVPARSSSPANFKTTLTMSTRYIEFAGFQGQARSQCLQISVINRGQSAFEMKHANGKFAPVTPGTRVELYNG